VKAIFGLVILAALIAGAAWFLGFIEHSRTGLEHGCKQRVADPMDLTEKRQAEAGIMAHETPIAEFSVADRDRQDYVCGLLFEVAYAVASRSANPAALVAGDEEAAFYSYAERLIKKWAETSAAELEQLLESL
jgi:hypothetical protein